MTAKRVNPHASALGKLSAKARMKKIPAEVRSQIAQIAGRARWKNLSTEERSQLAARGGKASKGRPKTRRRKP